MLREVLKIRVLESKLEISSTLTDHYNVAQTEQVRSKLWN